MEKYYCNPVNINYRYQFNHDLRVNKIQINREAADPSMIQFKNKYYIFASMNLSVWVSNDLVNWESNRLPENLPLYDYAPDVRVQGEYVYFSASKRGAVCNFYRTKDILNGPYEEIKGTFDFWDPNLFFDDDGRIYFYWGCSNMQPIWGVELEAETMLPKGEKIALVDGDSYARGYERIGIDHSEFPKSQEDIELAFKGYLQNMNKTEQELPTDIVPFVKGMFSKRPFIEGPWVERYNGKYYLQYAAPGAEYNTYADGVYISNSPLGPYKLAENNPFSYQPGGFMPGAGHGSTMWDRDMNLWHTSTMRISVNHQFERRVGIWPAGFDKDDELYCNQNYGTWPRVVESGKINPWDDPVWYLLSYGKKASCSSYTEGRGVDNIVDEDSQTCWKAETNNSGEWVEVDLGEVQNINAVQINFADSEIEIPIPGKLSNSQTQPRYIDERDFYTRWILEGSVDGKDYFVIENKSKVLTDLPHDFIVRESGIKARYVKLTVLEIPYNVNPCVSGLRVFGIGKGEKPCVPNYTAKRSEDRLNLLVNIENTKKAIGFNVLCGHAKDKLYHSYQLYVDMNSLRNNEIVETVKNIGALVKEQDYFVRVDAFNENGITVGNITKLNTN